MDKLLPRYLYVEVDSLKVDIVCLFGLRLYVPLNNFSIMSGRSHRFLGITSTFW